MESCVWMAVGAVESERGRGVERVVSVIGQQITCRHSITFADS